MSNEQSWAAPGGWPAPQQQGDAGSSPASPPASTAAASAPPPGTAPPLPPRADPEWAPPPRPGLIPLRPLSFGTLLGAPFQVLRRNPRAAVGSGLLVQIVVVVVTGLVLGGAFLIAFGRIENAQAGEEDTIAAGSIALILLSSLIPLGLSLVASAFLQGVMVTEVARGTLGEKLRLGALWRLAVRRLGPLVLWTLVVTGAVILVLGLLAGVVALLATLGGALGVAAAVLVAAVGLLGVLVLGAWLGTKTALVPSALVLERAGLRDAVRRSWALTTGSFWRTLGTLLLIMVILNVAAQVITTPVSLLFGFLPFLIDPTSTGATPAIEILGLVATTLITVVVAAVTSVVQASAVAVIYLDLRMRREGLDLVLQRWVEERAAGRDPGDPFAPPAPVPARGAASR